MALLGEKVPSEPQSPPGSAFLNPQQASGRAGKALLGQHTSLSFPIPSGERGQLDKS